MARDASDDARPTHQLATETYRHDPVRDFEVFQGVVDAVTTTLEREVER